MKLLLMAVGLVLLACSAEADTGSTSTATPTATPTAQVACLPVSTAVIASLADALTVSGGGTLRNAYAVRSPDHSKVWYVAADLQGQGLDGANDIATWAVNFDPTGTDTLGIVFSADAVAAEFSEWPRHDSVSGSHSAAQAAQRCARR